jgi:hypothetical protein
MVGVNVGVTNVLATVPPTVFVTVPGVRMRNPEGVDNGALTRTKLLAPESKLTFSSNYKIFIKFHIDGHTIITRGE